MAVYAIADLHLSLDGTKSMDIFGPNWEGYMEKIEKHWKQTVSEGDTVVLAGDFCWAMQLQEAYEDFAWIEKLPGKKILLKGNHDYWWNTITCMRNYLKEQGFQTIDFLYNNSYCVEDIILAGTRGWTFNGEDNADKIIQRENQRLELSLADGRKCFGQDKEMVAFIHYPPIVRGTGNEVRDTVFLQTLQKYDVKRCYYGHLHGGAHKEACEGEYGGITFKLISGDYTNFSFVKVV